MILDMDPFLTLRRYCVAITSSLSASWLPSSVCTIEARDTLVLGVAS